MSEGNESFGIIDYTIFSLVLLTSLAIGIYHAVSGGKQRTTKEYLMANRRLSTLPVALSILVSFVSGILVLGTPAEMYTRGTQLMMRLIGYCLACFLSSRLLVPLFFSLRVTSSFEYLERRYRSQAVKLIGTIGMLVGNLFYMGLVVFTPAVALEAVTGFPLWASIGATAVVATLYTTVGGLKAVIWTDVFQAGVIVVGMMAIVGVGMYRVGGPARVWELNEQYDRIIFFDFNPDPTVRLSFWSTVFGGMFSTLTIFGVGQTSVQRYCALPTLSQAQNSVYLNIPFLVVVNALAAGVGLVMFAYYADLGCDPLANKEIRNSNQLLPYFVIKVLRDAPGLPGAFLAVLFSGALSSMSSSLNSAAAVTWQDILKYLFRDREVKESWKVLITKLTVLVYGTLTVFVALGTKYLGVHVLQASMSFTGATMGPTLGMFLLGALSRRANAKGAVVGCLISAVFSLWLAIGTFIVWPHRQTLPTPTHNCSNLFNSSILGYNQSHSNGDGSMLYSNHPDTSSLYDNTSSLYGNISTSLLNTAETKGLNKLYEISFLWYSFIGCAITMIIGYIVSLVTSSSDDPMPDDDLIISITQQLCCCCSPSWFKSYRHRKYRLDTIVPDSSGLESHKYSADVKDCDRTQDILQSVSPLSEGKPLSGAREVITEKL